MTALVLALVFVGTFGVIVGAAVWSDRARLSARRQTVARLAQPVGDGARREDVSGLVRADAPLSALPWLARLLAGRAMTETLMAALRRADVEQPVGVVVLAMAACGAAGLAAAAFAGAPALVALLAAAATACVPRLALDVLARRRARQVEAQLPEALDTIVSALKAGCAFTAALEAAAAETPAPLGPELGRVRDAQRLGMELRGALAAFAERVDTPEARMVVTAVLLQRETGGNLAELLGNLATLIRERATFRGKVQTLTAEPRMSALVLALLPVAIFALLFVLNPSYMQPMLQTGLGRALLGFAGAATVTGYVVMRRMGAVEL